MAGLLRGCRAQKSRGPANVFRIATEIGASASSPAPYSLIREFQDDGRSYVMKRREPRGLFLIDFRAPRRRDRPSISRRALIISSRHLSPRTAERSRNGTTFLFTPQGKNSVTPVRGRIEDVSSAAQKHIVSVQPCFASTTPNDTILAAVRQLNNTDKHQLLLVLTAVGDIGQEIEMGGSHATIVGLKQPERLVEINESGVEIFRILLRPIRTSILRRDQHRGANSVRPMRPCQNDTPRQGAARDASGRLPYYRSISDEFDPDD